METSGSTFASVTHAHLQRESTAPRAGSAATWRRGYTPQWPPRVNRRERNLPSRDGLRFVRHRTIEGEGSAVTPLDGDPACVSGGNGGGAIDRPRSSPLAAPRRSSGTLPTPSPVAPLYSFSFSFFLFFFCAETRHPAPQASPRDGANIYIQTRLSKPGGNKSAAHADSRPHTTKYGVRPLFRVLRRFCWFHFEEIHCQPNDFILSLSLAETARKNTHGYACTRHNTSGDDQL